jgi:DNA primase
MPRYTDDSKEKVRDAVDMIALVSSRTELRRAGVNSYFGRCPFHEERTGSFHVRPEEKHYHCFGCQMSGDPFRFVMETEGLDFVGAMESLAERFGVTLEVADEDPMAKARRERRERLHKLLDRAAAYYARYLWEAGEAQGAREYLAARGLEEATLRTYRVGYAPSAWDRLLLVARQAGFSEDELLATGLAQRSKQQRGSIYDRFRERIMFPLADARGRVVGFGARAMRDNQPPKYLNTSEGEVFHKGSQLFGIDLARKAAARAGSIVLAEGYTDVLALHQAGIENAVGIMGTSFTDEQARELERTARTLVLALDADGAGQEAMLRAARVAAGRRLELRVVPLPPGTDPADLVAAEGARAMQRLVDASVPFVRFRVERELSTGDTGTAEGKDAVISALRPVFAQIPPSALREELIALVADRTDLSPALVGSWLAQGARAGAGGRGAFGRDRAREAGRGPSTRPPRAVDAFVEAEQEFLVACLAAPKAGGEALTSLDVDAAFTDDLTRRAARHLRDHLQAPLERLGPEDGELSTLIAKLSVRAAQALGSADSIEGAAINMELMRVRRDKAAARASGQGGVAQLAAREDDLRRRLDRIIERAMATQGGDVPR